MCVTAHTHWNCHIKEKETMKRHKKWQRLCLFWWAFERFMFILFEINHYFMGPDYCVFCAVNKKKNTHLFSIVGSVFLLFFFAATGKLCTFDVWQMSLFSPPQFYCGHSHMKDNDSSGGSNSGNGDGQRLKFVIFPQTYHISKSQFYGEYECYYETVCLLRVSHVQTRWKYCWFLFERMHP